MSREYIPSPLDFESEIFAENNRKLFDDYIDWRMKGETPLIALRLAFGEEMLHDGNQMPRIYGIERNPYFREAYANAIMKTPIHKVWNPQVATHELLRMARNPFARDSSRLAAMKELNVLCGITVVDESGRSKAGRTLADFYADQEALAEKAVAKTPEALDPAHTTH